MKKAGVLIIAEAGVNHNGSIDLAKELIDVAAQAGADLVKFQMFSADRLVTPSASKANYQEKALGNKLSQYEMLKALELSSDSYEELIAYSHEKNIGIFSTGFDVESMRLLISYNQDLIKIPSGEITNLPYLQFLGKQGKKLILSTGMSDMNEVRDAIEVLEGAGSSKSDITVLHCTTEYPAPMRDVNLEAMLSMQNELGVNVGYSDHTDGIEVAIAAVAMGAKIIEKHFTLSRDLPGPDHKASLEPKELEMMVRSIRNIELALGDGVKKPANSELKNISIARKSIVASRTIRAGEVFSENNLTVKRPGKGISPMQWFELVGQTAARDFAIDELIEL